MVMGKVFSDISRPSPGIDQSVDLILHLGMCVVGPSNPRVAPAVTHELSLPGYFVRTFPGHHSV